LQVDDGGGCREVDLWLKNHRFATQGVAWGTCFENEKCYTSNFILFFLKKYSQIMCHYPIRW
jgi:hypothetical protein